MCNGLAAGILRQGGTGAAAAAHDDRGGARVEHSKSHHSWGEFCWCRSWSGRLRPARCALGFILFLAAGISDAVDGFLAKQFGMSTELGAYLDPLADKTMLVSIYVALGIMEVVPLLARHSRGLSRYHDCRRFHSVVACG